MTSKHRTHPHSARARKWRSGGYSVLLCVLSAALWLLVNISMSSLETSRALKIDLSFNRVTTQSATTRNVLRELAAPVHVYAVMTSGSEDEALITTLERYAAANSLFTYSVEDIVKNPVLLASFPGDVDSSITSECLIAHCPQTGRYKVVTSDNYISLGYSEETGIGIEGIAYEKCISEAIVYVTSEDLPTVALLSGHGELNETATSDMEAMITSCNYAVKRIDLTEGDTLEADAVLFILSPQKDLTSRELEAIETFAAQGGTMLITCDYTDDLTDMPLMGALLRAYGVTPLTGLVVASDRDAGTYYSDYPAILIPSMLSCDATQTLLAGGADKLLLAGSRAFDATAAQSDYLYVTPMLQSGNNAYLRDYTDGLLTIDQQESDRTGPFTLGLTCERVMEDGTRSRAVILGSSVLMADSSWYSATNNAEFALQMIRYLNNSALINLDIPAKTALRYGIPASASMLPAVICVILLPILVMVVALMVLLPRRNR